MALKELSAAECLVRLSYIADVGIDQVAALMRPENAVQRDRHIYGLETSIVKSFAPGDVLTNTRFVGWMNALYALLLKSPIEEEMLFREIVRRDFPRQGHTTGAFFPLDASRLEPLAFGNDCCYFETLMMSTEGGDKKTSVEHTFMIPRTLQWMLPLMTRALSLVCSPARLEGVPDSLYHVALRDSPFLMLRLRKCCRGPPLVPSKARYAEELDELGWEPAEEEDFSLGGYLQKLLAVCGVHTSCVFDCLDGRPLVFFQAAVPRTAWPCLWDALEPVLKKQQTAYRRRYGGTGAPRIDADVEPRFRSEASTEFGSSVGLYCSSGKLGELGDGDSDSWDWQPVPVKNTFVHFPSDASTTLEEDACSAP